MRPKKPEFEHLPQLLKARQVDLVLHGRSLDAGRLRGADDGHRLLNRAGDRLLQIDVLAGRDRLQGAVEPAACCRNIEVDVDRLVRERGSTVGRPLQAAVCGRQSG